MLTKSYAKLINLLSSKHGFLLLFSYRKIKMFNHTNNLWTLINISYIYYLFETFRAVRAFEYFKLFRASSFFLQYFFGVFEFIYARCINNKNGEKTSFLLEVLQSSKFLAKLKQLKNERLMSRAQYFVRTLAYFSLLENCRKRDLAMLAYWSISNSK